MLTSTNPKFVVPMKPPAVSPYANPYPMSQKQIAAIAASRMFCRKDRKVSRTLM